MKQLIKPIIIIVAAVLLAIIAGGTIALAISSRVESKKVSMTTFAVSGVEADVVSSSDGEKHPVSMNFYFEISDELANAVSTRETRKQLKKIISELDYDKLVEGDSVGYVRDNVIQQFSQNIDREDIGNVYITDMVTGKLKFYTADEEEEETQKVLDVRTQQRFNALFNVTD